MKTAQLTRLERIANLENYLIENKLGSDSLAFTELMLTTSNVLGSEFSRQYDSIKCHSMEDMLIDIHILIKQGYAIAEACSQVSGSNHQDFYKRLDVGQMAKLQSERLKFKQNINQ